MSRPSEAEVVEALRDGIGWGVPVRVLVPCSDDGGPWWGITLEGGVWVRNDRLAALALEVARGGR